MYSSLSLIAVVVWLDSFRIYTNNKKLNPDLKSACETGHFRPAEYVNKDEPTLVYWNLIFSMNTRVCYY